MTGSSRNPPWEYDEIILALDLYLRERRVLEEYDPAVVELSRILNEIPLHPQRGHGNFRSQDAVVLKLANLRAHDPATPSSGMSSGGKRTAEIWDRFSNDPDEVRRLADSIRNVGPSLTRESFPEEVGSLEGKLLVRRHRQRERDPKLSRRRRDQFLAEHGRLFCEICDFEPTAAYGSLGEAAIECHHVRPLSSGGQRLTRTEDLVLLCANCHRVAHSPGRWLDLTELRQLLNQPGN